MRYVLYYFAINSTNFCTRDITHLTGYSSAITSTTTWKQSRVAFYMFMSMVETEEEQKLGVVCVYYLLDASNLQSVTGKLRSCVPVHFVSLHLCYNDITQYALTCMGVYALSQRTKVRFRPHYGKQANLIYKIVYPSHFQLKQ